MSVRALFLATSILDAVSIGALRLLAVVDRARHGGRP